MKIALSELRQQLDEVDKRLVAALADRMNIVTQVARYKVEHAAELRDIIREEELLTKLVQYARRSGLDSFFITTIYQEVLEHSVRLQQHILSSVPAQLKGRAVDVGYCGSPGSYAHLAAQHFFGLQSFSESFSESSSESPSADTPTLGEHKSDSDTSGVIYRRYESFSRIFTALSESEITYAILPLENTSTGSVHEVYDRLTGSDWAFVGEEVVRVEYCLAALDAHPLEHITRVYADPQAIAQCSDFIASMKHALVESCVHADLAVDHVRSDVDARHAAIIPGEMARHLGLSIIRRNVGNQKENFTRYAVVALNAIEYDPRIPCKTSVLFATGHEQGALLSCLSVFAQYHLNLTKLESRPRPGMVWEYIFYVDFEGNRAQAEVQEALATLSVKTSFLKVLGSYPSRTTKEVRPATPRPTPVFPDAPAGTREQSTQVAPQIILRGHRPEDTAFEVRTVAFGGNRRVVILGDTGVADARGWEQLARIAKNLGVDMLWSGASRTHGFVSDEEFAKRLEYVEQAARWVDLPLMFRVGSAEDVEKVMSKVDVLYVEGVDSQNGYLLDAVGLADKPVVLGRNPLLTLEAWLQSVDRVLQRGNRRVALCETGVRTLEDTARTMADIAGIAWLRTHSHLPIFVYPGEYSTSLVKTNDVVNAAFAVGAQGVLLELKGTEPTEEEQRVWQDIIQQARANPART